MTSARWSPDGRWIAFDNGPGDHDIFLVRPDGADVTNLTATLSTGVCCPQWSPDGSMLVAQSGEPDQDTVDLWVVRADGSGTTQLTHHPGRYLWYAWSPVESTLP